MTCEQIQQHLKKICTDYLLFKVVLFAAALCLRHYVAPDHLIIVSLEN